MRDTQPRAIYLKDYRKPAFLVDSVSLCFELFEDGARVTAIQHLYRNPEAEQERDLVLDGEELQLEGVLLDGQPLNADHYDVDSTSLRVKAVPDRFELTVTTWIRPQENTRLEGLYKSSGMFCTQCEAEGFRRITYYLDRPDVMAPFSTRIEADRKRYPVLLSNGNEVERGDLDGGRHFVTWEDPFPKPCYLFALVAGDLVEQTDSFRTQSGRDVSLRMYVEPRNSHKTEHALDSLKRAMRWDEEVYGREYDLDIFMIVAVDDFNMGAMENKGLNIFNSSCVLANPETTTDLAFQRIESIVAHEYFHNWSGNRVTCRDWFQLSLKEGFTVFRDACFSADMGSPTVKRIEDVNMIRTAQFAEDAGPMAHPVRPDSYMEISNFYTVTVYEKGAEVVRMIHTLMGPEGFRKGSDLYFSRHDGQAVTTDDFVKAMEDANGRDLGQFRRWYEQAGTPVLTIEDHYDRDAGTYTLTIRQSCPPTPGQTEKAPFHIPFALGLLDDLGRDLPLKLSADEADAPTSRVLELTEPEHRFVFHGVPRRPVPSLLRHFSAPVRVQYPWTREQLMFLMSHDSDGFNRWDAGQRLAVDVIRALMDGSDDAVDERLVEAYRRLLTDADLDQALVSLMLALPTEAYLIELSDAAAPDRIHEARDRVLTQLATSLRDELLACYRRNTGGAAFSLEPEAVARRALRNTALNWLLYIDDEMARDIALNQYEAASNMTDRAGALRAIVNSGFVAERERLLRHFHERWHNDPQMVEQWFSVQSGSVRCGSLEHVRGLLGHASFDWKNPNKIRSVIGVFANQNLARFHAEDGSGYRFLAEQIIGLDPHNPQIAARLAGPLTRWRKYDARFASQMRQALESIMQQGSLSRDLYEVVHKSLKD
ncbi:aminopeptidase N [Mangrovitalea sediminis]|uniref:aminopeptidase N n=1 Tax=Mangrovitalea sediminis TaxID=1982043 RepID=UPI000BE56E3A|nr:aminopeptidase N [Mangrovitalea sediminis]